MSRHDGIRSGCLRLPPVGDSSCFSYDDCDMADIVNIAITDGFYIDIHTELYPDGEHRGQLKTQVPEPATLGTLGLGLVGLIGLVGLKRKRSATPTFVDGH